MIPEGWEEAPLVKVLEKIIDYRGQSVPKSDGGVPLITAKNVRKGYLDFSNQEFVSYADYEAWMKRGIPKVGDILFTTEAPLGNACRFPAAGKYAVGQRTVTLRANNKILPDFLLYYLLSARGQRLIDVRGTGSTAKGIKASELKKLHVLFPKRKDEQKKIAQILSTWDKAIETVEKLIENSQQKKKALMQQLLTGKKRFPGFDGEWKEVRLRDCADCLDNKRIPLNSEQRSVMKGSIPYWGANGIVDYVNDYIFDEVIILLAEDGGNFNEFSSREIARRAQNRSATLYGGKVLRWERAIVT